MGARPSSFRKQGGFLNGVDGVISDYQFTDEFNGQPFKPGRDPQTKKEKFHSLYCVLSARVDGADEDVTTTLFVGGADDWDVSDDGHVLTPAEGKGSDFALGQGTGFFKFLSSLVEAGFNEALLPEDSNDFSAIIGTRVRFVQRKDEEGTRKLGKRVAKDGKQYDRQDLVVDVVYDMPKAAAKPNGKTAAPSKPNGKYVEPAAEADVDMAELSGQALQEILKRTGKPILKSKASTMTLTTPLLKSHPNREDVRKWMFNDDNLDQLVEDNVINYDRDTQIISAV